jgi:hypothetical protein
MSEQRPIDWEATAASAFTSVMLAILGLLVMMFGVSKFGDPRTLLHHDWTANDGRLISGLVVSLFGAQLTWFALKALLRAPKQAEVPKTPVESMSREDLIRTAPWVDRLPTRISRRSIVEGIALTIVIAGLLLLTWRLPEATRTWVWLLFLTASAFSDCVGPFPPGRIGLERHPQGAMTRLSS